MNSNSKLSVTVCLLPSTGPTWAWARAVRAHVHPAPYQFFNEKRGPSISDAPSGVGVKNIFLPSSSSSVGMGGKEDADLWTWARSYERGRRVREVRREKMRAEVGRIDLT